MHLSKTVEMNFKNKYAEKVIKNMLNAKRVMPHGLLKFIF